MAGSRLRHALRCSGRATHKIPTNTGYSPSWARCWVAIGDFQVAVDPVQLYISIAALSFFYLSSSSTLSVIFGRDLLKKEAKDERLDHMVGLVLAALMGKTAAAVGQKPPKLWTPEHSDAE